MKEWVSMTLLWLFVASTAANATSELYEVDVAGIGSWDALGDSDNTVMTVDLGGLLGFGPGTPLLLTALAWDVSITTEGESWLSEATIRLSNSNATDYINLAPGSNDNFSGSASYSSNGLVDLAAIDADFPIRLVDGILLLEFYEDFDDVPGLIDATWTEGTLTVAVQPIPVPAALPLFLSILACAPLLTRRRRTARNPS